MTTNLRRSLALLLLLVANARADEPAPGPPLPPPPAEKPRSKFVFSLLPKSLQRKPSLDFHVITEMTAEGKKLKPPTPERPEYYLEQAGKFTQLGNNTPGNEHPPAVADLERAMQRALAASHYVRATPATPIPRYVVVFNYGSFARFSTAADDFQQTVAMEALDQQNLDANPDATPAAPFIPVDGERSASALLPLVMANPQEQTDVLQRAELIGGQKFAHELNAIFDQEALFELSNPGDDPSSPFNRFVNANDNLMRLVEESFSSCYFVIASAYDCAAMAKGERVLLWRTKMTVNSTGISMAQSLSPLIASAGPYFGRDMTEAVTITRRALREGRVEIGTPTVINDNSPPPSNAPTGGESPAPAKP